jgi:hypothetical protein
MGVVTDVVSAGKFAGGGSIDLSVLGCCAGTDSRRNLFWSNQDHYVVLGVLLHSGRVPLPRIMGEDDRDGDKNQDIEGEPPTSLPFPSLQFSKLSFCHHCHRKTR